MGGSFATNGGKKVFSSFLIKYAEIGVKGKNRYIFEDALVRQIKYALHGADGEFAVSKTPGRIFVDAKTDFDYEDAVERLQHVFGIWGICPMVRLEDEGFDKLCEEVVKYFDETYPDKKKTFKVNARRSKKN